MQYKGGCFKCGFWSKKKPQYILISGRSSFTINILNDLHVAKLFGAAAGESKHKIAVVGWWKDEEGIERNEEYRTNLSLKGTISQLWSPVSN